MRLTRRLVLGIGGSLVLSRRLLGAAPAFDIAMTGRGDGARVWFDPIGIRVEPGAVVRWTNRQAGNSHTASARNKLSQAGIAAHFDPAHVFGFDTVARPKPAPDLFLAAARGIGAEPPFCLAFEDSDTGVTAALAAGMTVVHVPDLAPRGTARAHHVAETILDGARDAGLLF